MHSNDTDAGRIPRADALGMGQRFASVTSTQPAIMALSVISILLLWSLGAAILPSSVLPAPTDVLQQMAVNVMGPQLWTDISITLRRIFFAFLLAMSVSTVLGFTMALSKKADHFFRIWIILGMTMPALVLILMSYMIVGLNDTAAIIGAALPVIAILTINIREGVGALDTRITAMARAFRASHRQMLIAVITPQVVPVLLASTRFGIGLIWKMVLFVELLGRGSGIGYRIEFYYQMFNMKQVLAHALSFLVVMLIIEFGIIGQSERRLYRWRRQ